MILQMTGLYSCKCLQLGHKAALLVFENVGQCSNVRQNLNGKFVAMSQSILGRSTHSNTSGCTGHDDSSRRKSGALRQPADDLGDRKDKVTKGWSVYKSFC